MKTLRLNKINKNQLDAEQMNAIAGGGGGGCGCSCLYAGQPGGSSTQANGNANKELCLSSPSGVNWWFGHCPSEIFMPAP